MPDYLQEEFKKLFGDQTEGFAEFQKGFTAGAVAMRIRALTLTQAANKAGSLNDLVNKIGGLSDIPETR